MRSAVSTTLILAVVLCLVSSPLLHLHPSHEYHKDPLTAGFQSAVIHTHMPDDENFHPRQPDEAHSMAMARLHTDPSQTIDISAAEFAGQPTIPVLPSSVDRPDPIAVLSPAGETLPVTAAESPPRLTGLRIVPPRRGPPSRV